jgi:hypothetical protein
MIYKYSINPDSTTAIYYEIYSILNNIDISCFKFDTNDNLPDDFDYAQFRKSFFFSLSLSFEQKERIINVFSSLSKEQIFNIKNVFEDEKSKFIRDYNNGDFGKKDDIHSLEVNACHNAYKILNKCFQSNLSEVIVPCSNLNYQFLSTKDLEHIWSLCVSEDGQTALIGFGRDEAGLIHINLNRKIIVETYWLPDRYVLSIDVNSNSKTIVGTNNGHLALIDLNRTEITKCNKISSDDDSIKCVKFSQNKNIAFAVTQKQLIAVNVNDLQILYSENIDFNPWDVLPIPNTDMVIVTGSQNRIDLFKTHDLSFLKIDSITCGSLNRDISSITFYSKNQLLITSSESGFLDMWGISSQGLEKKYQLDMQDKIYSLQCVDNYIAFSTSKRGAFLFNIEANLLINISDSCREGKLSLKKIDAAIYLLFFAENDDIRVADITNDNWELHRLTDLPATVDDIYLTYD